MLYVMEYLLRLHDGGGLVGQAPVARERGAQLHARGRGARRAHVQGELAARRQRRVVTI